MQTKWIAAGAIAAIVLAWCRARGPERASLGHYAASARLRLYLPFAPWRDWIAPNDHEVLRAVRTRALVGGLLILTLSAFLLLNNFGLCSLRTVVAPDAIDHELMAPSEPEPAGESASELALPPPIADPGLDWEAVEELRSPIKLYGTAKVKPIYRLHEVEGALITDIDPNSFWAMLGVREGDVVIELHGEPVDNPEVLVALMNALERDEHVEVAVRGANGEIRYLELEIPGDF